MTAITSRGRRGSTIVPNWRLEDPDLDPYDLKIALWLASHADSYCSEHVTRNEIARKTGISAGKVSGSLERLATAEIVVVETVETPQRDGGRRLKVTFDFDVWEGGARSPHDRGPVTTRPGPGHHMTGTKAMQEEEQENTPQPPQAGAVEVADGDFDVFWAAYPRKTAKPDALKAWKAALKAGVHPPDVQAGLDRWNRYWESRGEAARQFIPYPATWLRRRHWEDPVPAVPVARGNQSMAVLERMAEGRL